MKWGNKRWRRRTFHRLFGGKRQRSWVVRPVTKALFGLAGTIVAAVLVRSLPHVRRHVTTGRF